MSTDDVYDCIVLGLGAHGSSAVYHMTQNTSSAPRRVLGIEQFPAAPHTFGSSHGRARIIRTAYFEKEEYVPLLQSSLQLFKDLESQRLAREGPNTEPLLTLCGGLMIGRPEGVVVAGTQRSCRAHGLSHSVLSPADVKALYGGVFNLSDGEVAGRDDDAGYLVPEKCISEYLRLAEEGGASLVFGERVVNWEVVEDTASSSTAGLFVVKTESGKTFRARTGVMAVGAWAPELYNDDIKDLAPLRVERRALHWFEPVGDSLAEFAKIPVYIWDSGKTSSFYGFPFQPGAPVGGVKVAIHGVDTSDGSFACTPSTVRRDVDDSETEQLRALLKDRMPLLNGRRVETATCMYTCTETDHFIIDPPPTYQNVLLVSPCSGHGFKFSSVVGKICREVLFEGGSKLDIGLFSLKSHAAQRNARRGEAVTAPPPAPASTSVAASSYVVLEEQQLAKAVPDESNGSKCKLLEVSYNVSEVFKIPLGIDLNDKEQVVDFHVKYNTLYINLKGVEDTLEITCEGYLQGYDYKRPKEGSAVLRSGEDYNMEDSEWVKNS